MFQFLLEYNSWPVKKLFMQKNRLLQLHALLLGSMAETSFNEPVKGDLASGITKESLVLHR